jgi:hypothetical protein
MDAFNFKGTIEGDEIVLLLIAVGLAVFGSYRVGHQKGMAEGAQAGAALALASAGEALRRGIEQQAAPAGARPVSGYVYPDDPLPMFGRGGYLN